MCSYVFCNVEAISRRLRAFILTCHGSHGLNKTIFFPIVAATATLNENC